MFKNIDVTQNDKSGIPMGRETEQRNSKRITRWRDVMIFKPLKFRYLKIIPFCSMD